MAQPSNKIKIYLESGQKRTFASALDWPGWCLGGRDEPSALQALLDYGSRYAHAIGSARLGFHAPTTLAAFTIVERLKGNAATDFGAPNLAPAVDAGPVAEADLQRFEKILKACWRAFDAAAKAAAGKELSKGPRGGGRPLEGIIRHVLDANAGYLMRLSWKVKIPETADLSEQLEQTQQASLNALAAAAQGEAPARGPRGGTRWTPRYFVRRAAWHVLDHVWEIENRIS